MNRNGFRSFMKERFSSKDGSIACKNCCRPYRMKKEITLKDLLEGLGQKIGREWARENRLRRIDTSALQKWGEDLRSAKRKGASVLVEKIRKLDKEVDGIIGSG